MAVKTLAVISTETLCERTFTIEHARSGPAGAPGSIIVVHRIDGKRTPQDTWLVQREIESKFDRVHRILKGEIL